MFVRCTSSLSSFLFFFIFYILQGRATIQIPATVYTGKNMTLTCGPPDIDLGQISASEWTFNGQKIENGKRFEITSGWIYTLTVNNVILADIGTAVNQMEFTFLHLHFQCAHR